MKILIAISLSFLSIAASAEEIISSDQVQSSVTSLLSLYDSKCSQEIIDSVTNELNSKIDLKAFLKKSWTSGTCKEGQEDNQSKECLRQLDLAAGKWVRDTLRKRGCQVEPHWYARLAAASCSFERDKDQVRSDLKNAMAQDERGNCAFTVKKCAKTSVSDLESMTFNCALRPIEGLEGVTIKGKRYYTCGDSATSFPACSAAPIEGKSKFPAVLKPALFGSPEEIGPGSR